MSFQHVQFNFGNAEYRYPPSIPFKSLNGVADGAELGTEKKIVPRLVLIEELQRQRLQEDDGR